MALKRVEPINVYGVYHSNREGEWSGGRALPTVSNLVKLLKERGVKRFGFEGPSFERREVGEDPIKRFSKALYLRAGRNGIKIVPLESGPASTALANFDNVIRFANVNMRSGFILPKWMQVVDMWRGGTNTPERQILLSLLNEATPYLQAHPKSGLAELEEGSVAFRTHLLMGSARDSGLKDIGLGYFHAFHLAGENGLNVLRVVEDKAPAPISVDVLPTDADERKDAAKQLSSFRKHEDFFEHLRQVAITHPLQKAWLTQQKSSGEADIQKERKNKQ